MTASTQYVCFPSLSCSLARALSLTANCHTNMHAHHCCSRVVERKVAPTQSVKQMDLCAKSLNGHGPAGLTAIQSCAGKAATSERGTSGSTICTSWCMTSIQGTPGMADLSTWSLQGIGSIPTRLSSTLSDEQAHPEGQQRMPHAS